MAMKIIY